MTGTDIEAEEHLVERERPPRPRFTPRAVYWFAGAVALAAVVAGIVLTVTWLNRPIPVPDLGDMTVSEAETYLAQRDFVLGDVVMRSSARAKNRVIDQSPAVGSLMHRNDPITLYVSAGDGMTVVPDIVGNSGLLAYGKLETEGIRYEVDYRLATQDANTVLSTDPPAGTIISFDTVVRVVVALDAVSLEAPLPFDMQGMTVALYATEVLSDRRDVPLEIANRLGGLIASSGGTVVQLRSVSTPPNTSYESAAARLARGGVDLVIIIDARGDGSSGQSIEYSSSALEGSLERRVANSATGLLAEAGTTVVAESTDSFGIMAGLTTPWIRYNIGNFRVADDVKSWTSDVFVDHIARSLYISTALADDRELNID